MKNPHEFSFATIEQDDLIAAAVEKTEKLFQENAIRVEEFRSRYGDARVDEAKAYEEECEAKFEKATDSGVQKSIKLGLILEGLVYDGEKNDWFGENGFTVKTSPYDDYKNKTDVVLVLKEAEGKTHLALAIDVVSSKNITPKFAQTFDAVTQGKLSRVEYFREETPEGEDSDFFGELQNVPKVVIGADAATVKGLAESWVEGKNSALATHFIQFQILEQILLQCQTFSALATTRHQSLVAEKYKQVEQVISRILEAKKTKVKDTGERDGVYIAIKAELDRLNSS